MKAVYVDDNESVRNVTGKMLEAFGFETSIYACPDDFLGENPEVDAIFSDYDMPGMSGIEMIDKYRDSRSVPACIITGQASGEDYRRIAEDCMEREIYMIKKPFELDELRAVAEKIKSRIG